jgi:hypothetical protein
MRIISPVAGYLFVLLMLSTGCDKMVDWYLGIPLQPDFTEKDFEPGMNIFGVLRPDSTGSYNNSFVYVQQVLPAVGDTTSEWEVTGATVGISYGDPLNNMMVLFVNPHPDSLSQRAYYRPEIPFTPQAGEIYRLYCEAEGLPVLEAETRMPLQPQISEGRLKTDVHALSFTVLTDSACHLLDVFVVSGTASQTMRLVPGKGGVTEISFSSAIDISHGIIMIYAYDRHLASYYVTSNVSVNFNKFRKPYSTVRGGYGVFGSLNLMIMTY